MGLAFAIDVARCCGCYNCQLACKDEHVDNDWTPYAKPQPETGQFWLKVEEHVCGTIPKVKMHYIPRLCNHCEKPACIGACTEGAISKRDDGLVLIEPEKCTGCKACVPVCPYDAIYFNDSLGLAQKCTGCAHLLDNGYKVPRCVEACPTDAMRFGEEKDLKDVADSRYQEIASLAKLALASIYHDTNRDPQAIEIYKQLADHPTVSVGKSTAQFLLASLYEEDNQPDQARKLYQQMQKENPSSQAAQMASQRLQALK